MLNTLIPPFFFDTYTYNSLSCFLSECQVGSELQVVNKLIYFKCTILNLYFYQGKGHLFVKHHTVLQRQGKFCKTGKTLRADSNLCCWHGNDLE